MRNKKEDTVLQYYLAKNKLRTTCLSKCLVLKGDAEYLNDDETNCLTNCSNKIAQFLTIAQDVYVKQGRIEN